MLGIRTAAPCMSDPGSRTVPPTFQEALKFWIKLGFISFGGPAGQIAIMHEYLVEQKKWVTEQKFLHALNYCMLLPGPEAQQLATYIGWLFHGVKGGLAAGILFVLPSIFILWFLSALYVLYGETAYLAPVFAGLKPAVVAIVVLALWRIARRSLKRKLDWVIAVAGFVAIFALKIPFPAIVLGALCVGIFEVIFRSGGAKISFAQMTAPVLGSAKRLFKQLAVFTVLWCIPLLFVLAVLDGRDFWLTLSVFYTKAALVTFGGAYAVLPYVSQVSVEQFGWLSQNQMIDGLALGETTPGPLIMVLAFVGFLAGYKTFSGSLLYACTALWLTVFYTFLPSFLFIFVGAPLVERTSRSDTAKKLLSPVSAVVVGVVLNLAFYFAGAVVIPNTGVNYPSLLWIGLSLLVLSSKRVSLPVWLAVSCVFGYAANF